MARRDGNEIAEKLSRIFTPQRLQQLKFASVVTIMVSLCGIFLWYLFAPKPAPQQAGMDGYNVTIPEATVKPAETDKRKVYEQERYEQQRREKLQSLGDVTDDRLPVTGEMADATAPAAPTAIGESDAAYRRISGEMVGFYTPPRNDAEVEALKEQVAALQSQLDAERRQPDPLALAEEQYKLARKYLGGGTAVDEEAVEQAKQRRDSRLSVMRPVREGEVERRCRPPDHQYDERSLDTRPAGGFHRRAQPRIPDSRGAYGRKRRSDREGLRRRNAGNPCRKHGAAAASGGCAYRRYGDSPQHPVIRSCDNLRDAAASRRIVRRIRRAHLRSRSLGIRSRRTAGAQRSELPRTHGPQGCAGFRRADSRHERQRHPFGRAAGVVRAGARRIAGVVAICRRETPRGEDHPQSQPSAIIDFQTAVKMKRDLIYLTLIAALMTAAQVTAQTAPEAPAEIRPLRIEAGFSKTVHILFPSPVTYIDIGSMDIIAGKADGAGNVVRVKAAVRNFTTETNLTVITEDGGFFTFDVHYAENPAVSTVNISAPKQPAVENGSTQPEPASAEGRVLLQEVGREKPATVKRVLSDIYRQSRIDVKGVRTKKYGIGVEVLGIYVHNDVIYIHTMISNETNISFEVDARQFIVADRKLAKRTAQQQTPLEILRVCNDPTVVRGHQRQRTVFALQKFTIPDDKVLLLEIIERNGARHQTVEIPAKELLDAKLL